MPMLLFAFQWNELSFGILIALALAAIFWIPYLMKEIRDGKRELGPLRMFRRGHVVLGPPTPTGAGDINPGRRGDPAPGQPDAQADPYSDRAQRNGPPIQS
jgi:hypothetical protein